ncbi:hypothetical protein SAMN05421538_11438 [Paracoccus isoporae]|uniref:Uncharacterized protein n=1 Tax=Paracoccus isoporae TaxID=591205 RepID=A0A1G7GQE1_9RHOB|nr:hypothetical protein [Paracoccus isoporae]SDE90326.1 hypothetical protein SAMN05421538_11438 [Paracoccus isoporae]
MSEMTPGQFAKPLQRLPRKPLPSLASLAIPLLACLSALLLGLALPSLVGADGWLDWIKCVLAALSAGITAYAVNRLAVDKGALHAAIGNPGAGVVSASSILMVGFGMFAGTYGGFALDGSERLRLEAFGRDQAVFAEQISKSAGQGARVGAALRSVASDLAGRAECEARSSCLSGRGTGGEGPVFRVLEGEAARAAGIARQWEEGAAEAGRVGTRLREVSARYRAVNADEGLSVQKRRTQAQALGSEITRVASSLNTALPVSLVAAYAADLQAPIMIPGQSAISNQVNDLRGRHGTALEVVIASLDETDVEAPTFPARSGVSDTLVHVGHFLPLALIIFVIELVFPITLWLYTFFGLRAQLVQNELAPVQPSKQPDQNHEKSRASSHRNRGGRR